MKTKIIGHVANIEKEQRKEAVEALERYPELTATAPDWLDKTAQKEWQRIVPLLKENSPVSELDVSMIATYCSLYSTIVECTKQIKQDGVVIETKRGPVQSPYFMALEKSSKDLRAIASQLGLSPIARLRLETHKALSNDQPKDEYKEMLS